MQDKRISSIDQFRGFAILAMVLSNYSGGVLAVPDWLKHAPDIGLTVNDLIAPLFIFAISLTFGLSFHRRLGRDGTFRAYLYFFTRYLAIVGLGALASAIGSTLGVNSSGVDWGVLQTIGVAGLITLIFIRLPSTDRLIIGAGILIIYQILLDRFLIDLTVRSANGGIFGSVNWAAMLILGTVLADLFHDEERRRNIYPWASLGILAAGIGLSFLVPISKHRVSSSYVLVSLAVSALVFLLFHFLSENLGWKSRWLMAWGKNPLVLYFLYYILIGIFIVPNIPVLYAAAPIWLVLVEAAILIGGISAVASWLDRRNIIIRL